MGRIGIEKLSENERKDYNNYNWGKDVIMNKELGKEDIEILFKREIYRDLLIKYQTLPEHLMEFILTQGERRIGSSRDNINNLLQFQEIPSDLITKYIGTLIDYPLLIPNQTLSLEQVEMVFRSHKELVCRYQKLPDSIFDKAKKDSRLIQLLRDNYRYNPSLLDNFRDKASGKLVAYYTYDKSIVPFNCTNKVRNLTSLRNFLISYKDLVSNIKLVKCIIPEDAFFYCRFLTNNGAGELDYIYSKRVIIESYNVNVWRKL